MKISQKYNSIPFGDVKCIWMSAGVVDYKLCDKVYDCDNCPFYTKVHEGSINREMDKTDTTLEYFSATSSNYKERMLSFLDKWHVHDDCQYYNGHLWIKADENGAMRVGIDSFFNMLLPRNWNFVQPSIGSYFMQDNPVCWITIDDLTFTLKIPLSGYISDVNTSITSQQDIFYDDPFGEGWLFTIKPTNPDIEKKKLISASQMRIITEKESLKLKKKLFNVMNSYTDEIGETMMDGGQPLSDIYSIMGKKNYQNIIISLFS